MTTNAMDQTRTGLPLDLDYSMSRQQVLSHLKLLDMYRVEGGKEDTITYITPAPDTDTKNGLFLQFKNDKLVEIAFMKTEMDEALYNRLVTKLLEVSQQWKSQGVETVYESKASSYYLYRDNRSYMTIIVGTVSGNSGRFSVTTTFSEKGFFEDSTPDQSKLTRRDPAAASEFRKGGGFYGGDVRGAGGLALIVLQTIWSKPFKNCRPFSNIKGSMFARRRLASCTAPPIANRG